MLVIGSVGRFSLQLVAAVLVLNAVSLMLRLVNLGLGHSVADADQPGWEHVPGLSALGVNFEANVPTWFNASLLVACALACRGVDRLSAERGAGRLRVWRLLAVGCAYASLDELMKLHERLDPHVEQLLRDGGTRTGVALTAAVLAAAAGIAVLARLLRGTPPATRRLLVLAGSGYVGGALVLDMANSRLAQSSTMDSVPYILASSVEELVEMLALTLFFFAVSSYAARLRHAPAPTGSAEVRQESVDR